MIEKIGFIGLGQMGKWMADNLLKSGFGLTVYDHDAEAMAFLADLGASRAENPAELARAVDLVFLCLPSPDVVEQVVWGSMGLAEGWSPGDLVIDCGTSDFNWTLDFAAALKKQGIRFVDAPVTGMEKLAQEARLTIICGGESSIIDDMKAILEAMGDRIVHMGPIGSGQLTKMINNLIFNANLAILAEVLPMAVKLGLNPDNVARVVNKGSGRSFASEIFLPKILQGRFNHGYALQKGYKDMVSGMTIAARRQIPLPMISAGMTTYLQALLNGLGEEDKGALIKVFERLLDVSFRSH